MKLGSLSRAAVMKALDEFQSVGRDAFLLKYKFGVAQDYFVRHPVSGMLCDSKAIAGAAYGYAFPELGALLPDAFSGGAATVAKTLGALGFDVVVTKLVDEVTQPRRPWTRDEVVLLVADYVQMLTMELTGQSFNKAARRRALAPLLNGRSDASIEFKRRNVSAVMNDLGLPRIRGYLPAENTQSGMLVDVISEQLNLHPDLDLAAEEAVERTAVAAEPRDFNKVRAQAPERRNRVEEPRAIYNRRAVRRDYLEREARNRSLGKAGEEFIVDFERWRLLKMGLGQLADRVDHVARTQGDGLGYDVLSFESDGRERFIEVKTTAFGEETPFFVSTNELAFAREEPEQFFLCRVFDFRVEPRFFELTGPIENHFFLDPATYKASLC
jgi:hypothetical protein